MPQAFQPSQPITLHEALVHFRSDIDERPSTVDAQRNIMQQDKCRPYTTFEVVVLAWSSTVVVAHDEQVDEPKDQRRSDV